MSSLTGKNILLGVTGGIAAYKSPDIVRRLRDEGADVRVVLTDAAARMVSPVVFQAVSGHRARVSLWDEEAEAAMGHIELARWADIVVVAPATAHVMSLLAAGSAGNLLTTLCLATDAPVMLAPAMNQAMWRKAATAANHETLRARGVGFVGPAEGSQACGDEGPGRMSDTAEIVAALDAALRPGALLGGKRFLVTAGPTREAIDPVRFISNRSSGKMGFAVAAAAARAGADVTLVAGPVSLDTPPGCERIDVVSAEEMRSASVDQASGTDVFVATAAVADYRPAQVKDHKIKKSESALELELEPAPDILAEIAALDNGPFTVGFAAETSDVEAYAMRKLESKGLDLIVANLVGPDNAFDKEDNAAVALWSEGREAFPLQPKSTLAEGIVALIAARLKEG